MKTSKGKGINKAISKAKSKERAKARIKISKSAPLFFSPVQAGFPSPAQDFIEKQLDLNEFLVRHPASTFFVRVAGDSMIDANMNPGDILIVDRSLEPKNETIILAILDGEFTVKRYNKIRGQIILTPENINYKPIFVKEESCFEVWGVVTHIIHEAK